MTQLKTILEALEQIAPLSLQEGWDNCGMQIDTGKKDVEKILVCLEITSAVLDEAQKLGADMIITHHPLYFRPISRIDSCSPVGKYTIRLIQSNISVYAAHTCFDKVQGGNNTKLCALLGIPHPEPLFTGPGREDYVAYIAMLPEEKPAYAVADELKNVLEIPGGVLRCSGNLKKTVRKIAVCTGAGADFMSAAEEVGCDLLITGDVRYHEARDAEEKGFVLLDAGHFWTEKIFSSNMAEQLRSTLAAMDKMQDPHNIQIFVSKAEKDPFSVFCE